MLQKYQSFSTEHLNDDILKLDLDSLLFRKKNDKIKVYLFNTKMPKRHCQSIENDFQKIIIELKQNFPFMESNIDVNIPGNYFTKSKGLNYSLFGLEYMFEKDAEEERTKAITIRDVLPNQRSNFKSLFEWKNSYFRHIHEHKTIKFNVYIKYKEEYISCFEENAEGEIYELINA